MLHHLSFAFTDIARSAAFYDAVLAPLGYGRVWEDETFVRYGTEPGKDVFALKLRPHNATVPGDGFHVAFAAPTREAVDAFTKLHWRMGARTTAARDCIQNMGRAIMRLLSLIRTGSGSRR